jgi:RNA polymerase sigma-70 factor, ECF subfamily
VTRRAATGSPSIGGSNPIPDGRAVPPIDDPAEVAARREAIRDAFVAVLQYLPPRQRAVLILREVLRWKASEVAELLHTSVAAVNSTLQRARAAFAAVDLTVQERLHLEDYAQRERLARYIDAFETVDMESLVSLLHKDATMSMSPG